MPLLVPVKALEDGVEIQSCAEKVFGKKSGFCCATFLKPTFGTGAREISTDVCEQICRSFGVLGSF